MARQEADQELRAALGEKANLDQVPTKTSQLNNDSGFIGTEGLQDYYTKTQTDEAISNALSEKDYSKYIESEDGKKRIYGDGTVSALSVDPGVYGPWTNVQDGTVDETWKIIEPSASAWAWENALGRRSQLFFSREQAEKATAFYTTDTNQLWTRTHTPGPEGWMKEGELALKSDISSSPYVASKEYVDSKLSSYVSKTEIVPSQMIPGAAETAYSAMKASLDGNGNEITATYASKNDLTAKQDKLPVNLQTGIYDISAWGAAQAAYVPWTGVEDKQIASATEPGIVKVGKNLTIDADGTLNAEGGGGSSSGGHTLVVKGLYKYGFDNTGHVYVDGLDVSYSVDSFELKPLGLGNTVPYLYLSAPELKFYNQTMFFRNGRCVDDKGSTTDVYGYTLLTADTTVSVYSFYCLAAGTRITLADGSEKNIEDIGYDDQLLVWNFDEGRPGSAKPFWIKKKETAPYFWDIRFDDGTSVRACGPKGHEFFSVDRQDFVYGDELAGHMVLKQDGKTAKCVSSSPVKEGVDMYNLMTEKHVNCFANGVLAGCSLCRNLYGIEGLRFVKEPKKLRGYDEFEGEVPLWWFNAARYAESSSPHEKLVKYYKDRIGLMK